MHLSVGAGRMRDATDADRHHRTADRADGAEVAAGQAQQMQTGKATAPEARSHHSSPMLRRPLDDPKEAWLISIDEAAEFASSAESSAESSADQIGCTALASSSPHPPAFTVSCVAALLLRPSAVAEMAGACIADALKCNRSRACGGSKTLLSLLRPLSPGCSALAWCLERRRPLSPMRTAVAPFTAARRQLDAPDRSMETHTLCPVAASFQHATSSSLLSD